MAQSLEAPHLGLQEAPHRRLLSFLGRPGMGRVIVVLIILAIWQVSGLFVDKMFFAPPSRMIADFGDMLATRASGSSLMAALGMTFVELVVAFGLSVVFGTAIGLITGLHGFSRRSLLPIVIFLYGIPQVTVMPLILMIFGIGAPAKITFGLTHAIFPIILTVAAGVQNIEPSLLRSAHSLGATRLQVFRYITFPHMVPAFFSGMRLGMVGAILGVLLAELYVSSVGIGFYTRMFTDNFRASHLFGLVILLAAMAVLLNETLRMAENHFSRWRSK